MRPTPANLKEALKPRTVTEHVHFADRADRTRPSPCFAHVARPEWETRPAGTAVDAGGGFRELVYDTRRAHARREVPRNPLSMPTADHSESAAFAFAQLILRSGMLIAARLALRSPQ